MTGFQKPPSRRTNPAAQTPGAQPHDKWQVLNHLRLIAPSFDLKPRELTTLQALISFIEPGEGRFTVYAANETLRARLMYVSERTIQRHVKKLEALGLLERRLSANRKRFTLGDGEAFGFDLTHLYAQEAEIAAKAEAALHAAARARSARQKLLARLRGCIDRLGPLPRLLAIADQIRLALRRANTAEAIAPLSSLLDPLEPAALPDKTTAIPRQNAALLQDTDIKDLSVSSPSDEQAQTAKEECAEDLNLSTLLDACSEVGSLHGARPAHWQEAEAMAQTTLRYLGIADHLAGQARVQLGPKGFVATAFLILQRYSLIRNPPGYLRGMLRKSAAGELHLARQCRALLPRFAS